MVKPAELLKTIGKPAQCDRALPPEFDHIGIECNGVDENSKGISFPSDFPQTENYSKYNHDLIKRLQIQFSVIPRNLSSRKRRPGIQSIGAITTSMHFGFHRSDNFSRTHPR